MNILAVLFVLGLQVGLGILAMLIAVGGWVADLA